MTVIDLLGATPAVLQLPIGKEADFAGVVDLVQMKAIIWKDESLGAEFDVTDIPDDLKEKAAEYREKLVELAVEQGPQAVQYMSRTHGHICLLTFVLGVPPPRSC